MTKSPLLLRVTLAAALVAGLAVASARAQTVQTHLPAAWEKAKHHHAKPTPTPGPLVDPDGTWIGTATANWSNAASWSGGASFIADGGGKADFGTIDIPVAGVTVRLQVTNRTVREIDIGDTNGDGSYTINSTGATLFFDNTANSANAQLNQRSGSNGDTISAPVVLNSSLDVTNASAKTLTVSGNVSSGTAGTKTITSSTGSVLLSGVISAGTGDIAILQNGPGTLILSNANTYGGGTAVLGGVLQIGTSGVVTGPGGVIASGPVGIGTLVLGNGATLESTATNARSLQNNLNLSGNVTLGDAINTGKVTFSSTDGTNTLGIAAAVTLTSNTAITNPSAVAINDVISGNFSLTKSGNGTLTLGAANLFTGGVIINAGIVSAGASTSLGPAANATLTFGAGSTGDFQLNNNNVTVVDLNTNVSVGTPIIENTGNAGKTLTVNTTGNDTFAGVLQNGGSGTLALTLGGTGSLTLSGTNTYTGGTSITNTGTLNIKSASAIGTGTLTFLADGAVINNTSAGAITLSTNNAQAWNANFTFGGSNDLNMGTGLVTLNGSHTLTANAGTLTIGGIVDIDTTNTNSRTLTVTGGGNVIFNGTIQNSFAGSTGSLTYSGAGSLTLNGADTYNGATTLNSGSVSLGNKSAFGTSTVNYAGSSVSASTNLSGANAITNQSTLSASSTFTGTNSIELSGAFTNAANDTLTNNITGGTLTLSGTVNLSANGLNRVLTLAGTGNTLISGAVGNGSGGATTPSLIDSNTGILTLSGPNTFGGGLTLNSTGTINLNNASALGTGTFTIAANGIIDTTGGALTLSTNNAQAWTTSFTFGGTNDLNLGTGLVTMTGSRTLTAAGSTLTVGGTVDLNAANANARTLTVAGPGNVIFNGTIQNSFAGSTGNLAYTGAGTLTLNGSSTYNGTTTLTNGSVVLGNKSALGTSSVNWNGSGVSANTDLSGANAISNAGTLSATTIFAGTNNLELSGLLTASGSFNITNSMTAGLLTLSGGVALSNSAANNIITFKGGGDTVVSSAITNGASTASGITKIGVGSLTFAGSSANTYTGLTTVSAGELDLNKSSGVNSIAGDGIAGTTDVTVNGGTLRWKSANQVADDVTILESAGTVDLNGKTETLGGFSNSGGTFTTGKAGSLIVAGGSVTWSGGTNTINSAGSVEDKDIFITGGTNTIQGQAGPPAGTGAGGTLKVDAGGSGLNLTGATLTLNSDSTNPGTVMLLGDLTAHASATTSIIANGGNASVNGTIDLGGGTRNVTVDLGAAAVGLNVSASFSNGTLNKTGSGTLELSGPNFHGATTVSGGTLQADVGSLVNVTGNITVNSGGTLLFNGNGRHIGANVGVNLSGGTLNTGGFSEPSGAVDGTNFIGALTLTASSTVDFGAGNSSVLEFSGIGPHTLGTSVLNVVNWDNTVGVGGAGGDRLLFNGLATTFVSEFSQSDVSFDGQQGYTAIQIALGGNAFYEVVGVAPVPEPGTWVAAALVGVGIVFHARKRRNIMARPEMSGS